MPNFLAQFKTQKKIGGSLLLACCVASMLGCSRSDDNKNQQNTASSAEQTEMKSSLVDCSNEKANAAIVDFLKNKISQQATSQAQLIEQQANTAVDINILKNSLSQVAISLQSSNTTPNSCKATVAFDLPQAEIENANKIYTRLRQPVLAEQATSRGYELQNNTLVAKNLSFDVASSGGNYQVNMKNGEDATGLIAEILANASLAKTLTGSNAPVGASTGAAATAIANATQTNTPKANSGKSTSTSKQATKEATVKHHKPKHTDDNKNSEKPKSSTTTVRSSTKYTTTETTTTIRPKAETPKSDTPKKTVTETTTTTTKPTTTTETITHQKVPTDSNIKLNIEEKNEQY